MTVAVIVTLVAIVAHDVLDLIVARRSPTPTARRRLIMWGNTRR